jgi:hypothetical protein
VLPWLITTSGWPVLVAHVVAATTRLVADPALAVGVTAGAGAGAGATSLGRWVRFLRRRVPSG